MSTASFFSKGLLDSGIGEVINPDTYFQTNLPPRTLPEDEKKVKEFVNKHNKAGRRIVLITSGGTTVPLENNTVRFLDNFSAGTRGATSAEYPFNSFLQFSLQPYSRHYTHSTNCFLDFIELKNDGHIEVISQYVPKMKSILEKYQKVKQEGALLLISFVTVADYLFLLRSVTQIMKDLNEHAMYYLAAAVSDFFIPSQKMVQHKIQSADGGLTLTMDQVPKFLKPLVTNWAPKGFIVSFKLETDPFLLVDKSRQALTKYGHQIVIGNLLTTRKQEVTFITKDSEPKMQLTEEEINNNIEIESKIVPELVKRHDEWIKNAQKENS
ncbi:DNA/pantothenate metabolism flavo protein [Glomus cerebriforme]|uniref:DNA/pantothenate metabolism flavo protein n=1 Tax=Glomus cerebriforme TaxID=658196 RepID=A0A397T679_9GLOM|nr:DNA/pantothenate metabolism flavo protein [Glomus cerebriforme]